MKQKLVPSAWLEKEGRRLGCGPCLSGAMEAKVPLERLPVPRADLCSLTHGREGKVHSGPQFARNYVSDPDLGVPFLKGSTVLFSTTMVVPVDPQQWKSGYILRKCLQRADQGLVIEGNFSTSQLSAGYLLRALREQVTCVDEDRYSIHHGSLRIRAWKPSAPDGSTAK